MSRVDVIVPCYNYGRFLRECVGSALDQPGVEVRVLIIDDASSDDTPVVGADLTAQDGRVEFRRHEVNRGHIATYNEGLEWASGDYVYLLSADDLLTRGALRRAVRLMDDHPAVGLVYGRHIDFRTGEPLRRDLAASGACGWQVLSYPEFLEMSCRVGHTPIESPTALVRNSVHKQVGGYRPELPHSGDTELWLRLAAVAPVGVLEADQAFRRWHETNMTFKYDSIGRMQEQRAAFETHFRDHSGQVPDLDRSRRLLQHALAESSFWGASHAFERGEAALCRNYLEFAVEMDPSIQSSPEWSHLRWKRLLGPAVWSMIQPLADMTRGLRSWNRPAGCALP